MPSKIYDQCLAEARDHHLSSKTYSGKFLRPHAPNIKAIIDRLGVRSILDYGCGKGQQYRWRSEGPGQAIPMGMTIEEFWGVPVTKYDPAFKPYAAEPEGRFDLVICTHVAGSIPRQDLPWFRATIERYATKAVYYAEKLGPVGKQVFSRPDLLPRDWTREEWAEALRARHRPGLEVWLATRAKAEDGEVITEYGKI